MNKKSNQKQGKDDYLKLIQRYFETYRPSIGEIYHPDFVNEEFRLSFIYQLVNDQMVKRAEICFMKHEIDESMLKSDSLESPNYVVYRTDLPYLENPVLGKDGSLEQPLPTVKEFYLDWVNYGRPIIQIIVALDENAGKRITFTDGRAFYLNEKEEDAEKKHEIVDKYGFLITIHFQEEKLERDFFRRADEIIHKLILN